MEIMTAVGACAAPSSWNLPFFGNGMTAEFMADSNEISMCGGVDDEGNNLDTCFNFNFETESWLVGPLMTAPRTFHTGGMLEGQILITGNYFS